MLPLSLCDCVSGFALHVPSACLCPGTNFYSFESRTSTNAHLATIPLLSAVAEVRGNQGKRLCPILQQSVRTVSGSRLETGHRVLHTENLWVFPSKCQIYTHIHEKPYLQYLLPLVNIHIGTTSYMYCRNPKTDSCSTPLFVFYSM